LIEGRLYFITKPDPDRPIELKYRTEFDETQKWFEKQEDALLFLFDNGVRKFQFLTKELSEYKSLKNLQTLELWHLENRVGYVLYDYQSYVDEKDEVKKRKAYIWRFVGYGRSCFAKTKEELNDKVLSLIHYYKEDQENCGHNTYPYYTRYYR
jgi:hypothetical protein